MTAKAVDQTVSRVSTASAGYSNIDIRYIVTAARQGIIGLEEAADALLAACGALGKGSGTYTETQLNRKMRLEEQRLPELDEAGLSEDTVDYITQLQIDELAELAELTPMQDICYRLHCEGLSGQEIAEQLCLSAQAVSHHMHHARTRIRRACREGRYAGWYRIYLSEVNRTGSRPRYE